MYDMATINRHFDLALQRTEAMFQSKRTAYGEGGGYWGGDDSHEELVSWLSSLGELGEHHMFDDTAAYEKWMTNYADYGADDVRSLSRFHSIQYLIHVADMTPADAELETAETEKAINYVYPLA